MNIFLLNDTSMSHAGCQAAMDYIYRELKDHTVLGSHKCHDFTLDLESFDRADLILCNGEGSIHHNNFKANFLMSSLEMAQKRGIKTALINTSYQDMDEKENRHIIDNLDYIHVREPFSHNLIGGELAPDLCVSAYFEDVSRGTLDTRIKRRYAKGGTHHEAIFNGILGHIDADDVLLDGTPFRDIIERLKEYNKYITGQYHGVYAAILAGIPFIPLPSNTWKIESLLHWIGKDDPLQFILDKWKNFKLRERIEKLA